MAGHIPKPFSRPAIDLDGANKREWRDVQWGDLQVDDLVVDLGVVKAVITTSELGKRYEFPNASILHRNNYLVKAFVKTNG